VNKMLIVEDDVLSRNLLRMIFKSDFEIDFCESGDDYYEKYSGTKFDIIIMDISLKGVKNGLELTKEIKEGKFYNDTPILCLSAHALAKTRHSALESGVDIFLTKPVQNSVLKEAVESLVKSKLERDQLKIL